MGKEMERNKESRHVNIHSLSLSLKNMRFPQNFTYSWNEA
jgi:hypothetical protein